MAFAILIVVGFTPTITSADEPLASAFEFCDIDPESCLDGDGTVGSPASAEIDRRLTIGDINGYWVPRTHGIAVPFCLCCCSVPPNTQG